MNEKLKRNKVVTIKLEEELVEILDLMSSLYNSIQGKVNSYENTRSNMIRNALLDYLSDELPILSNMETAGSYSWIVKGKMIERKLTDDQMEKIEKIIELMSKTEVVESAYEKIGF